MDARTLIEVADWLEAEEAAPEHVVDVLLEQAGEMAVEELRRQRTEEAEAAEEFERTHRRLTEGLEESLIHGMQYAAEQYGEGAVPSYDQGGQLPTAALVFVSHGTDPDGTCWLTDAAGRRWTVNPGNRNVVWS